MKLTTLKTVAASALLATGLFATDAFAEADYLRFTAEGGDMTVGMAGGDGTFLLEWTLDPTNGPWTVFEAGASNVTVAAGATAYFRQKNESATATAGGWGFAFTGAGTVAADGNVMSVLDRTTLATSVGENALAGLFSGCDKLTTAPKLPATTLGENCYKEMFKDCANLRTVRVGFTNWVDGATVDWLEGVSETGEFCAPVSLPHPLVLNGSSVPEGWMIYQPGVEILSVEPLENPFGSFKITYRLTGLYPNDIYRLDIEYAAKGRTARESMELGSFSDGEYTIIRSSKALFGGLVVTPEAHVKLSLYGRSATE